MEILFAYGIWYLDIQRFINLIDKLTPTNEAEELPRLRNFMKSMTSTGGQLELEQKIMDCHMVAGKLTMINEKRDGGGKGYIFRYK